MFLFVRFLVLGRDRRMVDMNKILLVLLALGLLSVPVFAQEATTEGAVVEGGTLDMQPESEVLAEATTESQTEMTAEEVAGIDESQVGALPGDAFYGFKRFFENVDKFFTFDKTEKAKKHAYYGKMRAVEAHLLSGKAEKLAAEGKYLDANSTLELMEQATADQNAEVEAAQTELEAAVEEGSATDEEVAEVENEIRNSIVVLQRVYEKAPESAKDGLMRALNNSINNYERHVEKMEEKGAKVTRGTEEEVEVEPEEETEVEVETGEAGNGKGQTEKIKEKNRTAAEEETEIEVETEVEPGEETEEIETEEETEVEPEEETEVEPEEETEVEVETEE